MERLSHNIKLNNYLSNENIFIYFNFCRRSNADNKKTIFKKFIRILFILLCLSGFLYQGTLLILKYTDGLTVVNTRFETSQLDKVPAITLCFNIFYSPHKLAKHSHHIKDILENINQLIDNKSNSNKTFNSLINFDSKLNQLIGEYNHTINSFSHSLDYMIDELSIDILPDFNRTDNNSLELTVKLMGIDNNGDEIELIDQDPVVSVKPDRSGSNLI